MEAHKVGLQRKSLRTAGARASFTMPRRLTKLSAFEGQGVDLRFTRFFTVIVGAAGVILVTITGVFFPDLKHFQALANPSTASGLQGFSGLLHNIYFILGGGIALLLSGIAGMAASHTSNKALLLAHGGCTYIAVGMIMAGAVLSNLVISDMAYILCEEEGCNPRDGEFTQQQMDLVSTELAIFDECCVANHPFWSEQATNASLALGYEDPQLLSTRVQRRSYGPCPSTGDVFKQVCPGIVPTIITEVIATLASRLCTCVPRNSAYNTVRQFLRTEAETGGPGCAAFHTMQFSVDAELRVPTQPAHFLSVVNDNYRDFSDNNPQFRESAVLPLVGSPAPPLTASGWPNGGFGCGLGLTKGFLWYSALFVNEKLRLLLDCSAACAIVSFIATSLTFAYIAISRHDNLELLDYHTDVAKDSRMVPGEPLDRPKSISSGTSAGSHPSNSDTREKPPEPATVTASQDAPQQPPNEAESSDLEAGMKPSVQRSTSIAVIEDHEIHEVGKDDDEDEDVIYVKKADFDKMEAKITAFYKKHEPSRLTHEGRVDPDVVNFALARGVDALNAKLMAKYGVDLSTKKARKQAKNTSKENVLADGIVRKDLTDLI